MKVFHVPIPDKVHFKARAIHRWARQKRWPGIALSAVSQDFGSLGSGHNACAVDHDAISNIAHELGNIAAHGLHVVALYVAITLLA